MKEEVVAVVPARKGSRGVPNKNIRLLNGKPLVAYAIETALKSRYITRVIVSTDSPEVKSIARGLNVEVRDRSAELCGDSVTLDSVVYDAVDGINCGLVVTMQPTSPTLSVTTLDAAIAYAIKEDFDTLISVVNEPHLAWRVDSKGCVVPAYEKRLNRQYLPPYYKETGAFLISKRSVTTTTSRIGERVGVFEVSKSEAIDIDTYDDLILAASHFCMPRIAFYVNGDRSGARRARRVLELADAFFTNVDIYYDADGMDRKCFGDTLHNIVGVNGDGGLVDKLRGKEYGLFVNDVASTTPGYMAKLRDSLPQDAKVVNIEDSGEGARFADISCEESESTGTGHEGIVGAIRNLLQA